jgi:hypothetical protein
VNWELSLEVRRSVSRAKGEDTQPALRNPARDAESSFEFGLQNILSGLHDTLRRQQRDVHGDAPKERAPLLA